MFLSLSVTKTRHVAFALALSLAACSGGHGTPSTPILVATPASVATAASSAAGLVASTLSIDIPRSSEASGPRTPSSTSRAPDYVSAKTVSVKVVLNSAPAGFVQPRVSDVTPPPFPNSPCKLDPANANNFKCTIPLDLPPGSDSLTVTTYSGSNATGTILSQQTQSFTVAVGVTNALSIALDANVASIQVLGAGLCQASGPIGGALAEVGSSMTTVAIKTLDAAGATIVAPGFGAISINGVTTSGSITGTNGNVGFTINQSTQTVTFTPTTANQHASVTIAVKPASSTDGLSFNVSKTFDLENGPSANGLSLIAYGANSTTGAVNFTRITLGGSGATDTFAAVPTPSLARTASTTEAGVFDIDHPAALAFDKNGNLLLANGGGTPAADAGNFACVPTSVLMNGFADATTISQNVVSPLGLAYDPLDNSVGLANGPPSAAYSLPEYLLTAGPYSASGNRNLPSAGGLGATAITDLSTFRAGEYAVALTTGTPKAPNGNGASNITVLNPDGTNYTFTDATIDDPTSLGVDSTKTPNQLVIGSSSPFQSTLDFYSLATSSATKTKSIALANGLTGSLVAVSSDGHVAVGGPAGLAGLPQVQVYDNSAARAPVGGPIPFNGTTTACGSTYIYDTPAGGTVVLNGITWLSPTKLLISLASGVASKQGLYVFDISATAVPAGFDDNTCAAFAAAPKNTGFLQTTPAPLSAAYLP